MSLLTMRLSPLVSERALPISLITTSISLGTGRSEFILGVAKVGKAGRLHACLSHPPRRLWTRFSDPPFRPEPNAPKRLLTSSYSRAISSVSLPRERYQPPKDRQPSQGFLGPPSSSAFRATLPLLCVPSLECGTRILCGCVMGCMQGGRDGHPSFFLV
jgi:hypothetical protein